MSDANDPEINSVETRLKEAIQKHGEDSLQVVDILEDYAQLLKSKKRALDAANMQAKARVIRNKITPPELPAAQPNTHPSPASSPAQPIFLKEVLQKYIGLDIGVNFKAMDKYHKANLANVGDDFFSIRIQSKLVIHYPFYQILFFAEGDIPISGEGLVINAPRVPLIVQTYVMATGSVGFGISF